MNKTFVFWIIFMLYAIPSRSQGTSQRDVVLDLLINGQYQEAIDTCSGIIRADTGTAWIWFPMGQAQKSLLQYDNALESFENALVYNPDYIPLLQAVAETWSALGNYRKALGFYQRVLEIDSTQIHARIELGHALQRENRHEEAIEIYRDLVLRYPGQYAYHKELGLSYLKADSADRAAWFLHNALNFNSNDQNLVTQLATIYNKRGDHALALNVVKLGLKHDTMALALRSLEAYCNYLLENTDTATIQFHRVRELGDSSIFTTKYYGLSLLAEERFEEALPLAKTVFLDDTTIAQHCYYVASAFSGLEQYDSALVYYERTMQILKPLPALEATIHRDLGKTETARGQYEKALVHLKRSYELNPQANEVLFSMASLYDFRLNQKSRALEYYQLFLDKTGFQPDHIEQEGEGPISISMGQAAYNRVIQIREELHFEGTLKK